MECLYLLKAPVRNNFSVRTRGVGVEMRVQERQETQKRNSYRQKGIEDLIETATVNKAEEIAREAYWIAGSLDNVAKTEALPRQHKP